MSTSKPHPPQSPDPSEERLDEALEETFPASDPISVEPDEPAAPSDPQKQPPPGKPA